MEYEYLIISHFLIQYTKHSLNELLILPNEPELILTELLILLNEYNLIEPPCESNQKR